MGVVSLNTDSSFLCSHLTIPKIPPFYEPIKHEPHKMVKHTQAIRRKIPDELFECVWPLFGDDA